MGRPRVYPDEFRERAVRLVPEWRDARGVNEGRLTAVTEQLGLNRRRCGAGCLRRRVEDGIVRG